MKTSTVKRLFWISFILRGASFLIMILLFLFQRNIKSMLLPDPELVAYFSIPFASLISQFISLLLHLILALILPAGLERGSKSIAGEICGYVLFCGVFSFLQSPMNSLFLRITSTLGTYAVASANALNAYISSVCGPISAVATTMLCLALGFSIANKKALVTQWQ